MRHNAYDYAKEHGLLDGWDVGIKAARAISGGDMPDPDGEQAEVKLIPADAVDWLADAIVSFANQLVQEYIDAGSEAEAIAEYLGPAVVAELLGWSDAHVGMSPVREADIEQWRTLALKYTEKAVRVYDEGGS